MSKQELTVELAARLRRVTAADLEWREFKQNAAERGRQIALQEVNAALTKRDRAVRTAVEAGLPLVELRKRHQGLHTTHANAVLDSLARTDDTNS